MTALDVAIAAHVVPTAAQISAIAATHSDDMTHRPPVRLGAILRWTRTGGPLEAVS
jgi:hypothetical protein